MLLTRMRMPEAADVRTLEIGFARVICILSGKGIAGDAAWRRRIIRKHASTSGNERFISALIRSLDNLDEAQIETTVPAAASRAPANIGKAANAMGGGPGTALRILETH